MSEPTAPIEGKSVKLPEAASLHEKAVQKAAKASTQPRRPRRSRKAPGSSGGVSSDVTTIVPNRLLLERTCEQFIAAHPLYTRYEITDEYTAVIR